MMPRSMKKKITTPLTPLRAIRKKCLDCSAGSRIEVRQCSVLDCPLYLYRMGSNPKRKGVGGGKKNLRLPTKRPTQ